MSVCFLHRGAVAQRGGVMASTMLSSLQLPDGLFGVVRTSMKRWDTPDYVVACSVLGLPILCCCLCFCALVCRWCLRRRRGRATSTHGRAISGARSSIQMAVRERKLSRYKSFSDDDSAGRSDGNEWERHADEMTGEPYWYNRRTGATSWDAPPGAH